MHSKRSIDLEASSAIGGIVKMGTKRIGSAKGAAFKSKKSSAKSVKEETKTTKQLPGSPKGNDKPAPKVAFPKSKAKSSRSKVITKGPDATHSRSADTGKATKLTPAQREAVRSQSRKSSSNKPLSPAVKLDDTFTPRGFDVKDKRSSSL